MTTSRFGKAALSLSAGGLVFFSVSTHAESTWTFAGTSNGTTAGNVTCTSGCSQTDATLYTAAFSSSTPIGSNSTFTNTTTLLTAWQGGLGVNDGASPEHAIDNALRLEMVLLRFDKAVSLTSLNIGWTQSDSDITVLAFNGTMPTDATAATAAADSVTSKTIGTLATPMADATKGWKLVGSYSNAGTGNENINTGGFTSSWWIVSAYNSTIGGGQGWGTSDYFKLYSVTGSKATNGVSEPGSLALAAMALFGVAAMRRRARSRAI